MPLTQINRGAAANDGTGDGLRVAFGKTNAAIAQVDTLTTALETTVQASLNVVDPSYLDIRINGVAIGSLLLYATPT